MRALAVYWLEAKYEFLKAVRMPAYAIPTLAFPAMFYLLFGIGFGAGKVAGGATLSTYLLASYGAFGVMGTTLFGFGVGVAVERGQGWMLLKRATPMPVSAYFAAKAAVAAAFGAVVVAILALLGTGLAGVRLDPGTWAALAAILVGGALPFCALGLLLGYLAGPNSAPAVVNLIYLPMGFASGMWIPIQMLPKLFRTVAPWLPGYHYAQLAHVPLGTSVGSNPWPHAAYLLVFTVCCLALARVAYVRDDGRTFG